MTLEVVIPSIGGCQDQVCRLQRHVDQVVKSLKLSVAIDNGKTPLGLEERKGRGRETAGSGHETVRLCGVLLGPV